MKTATENQVNTRPPVVVVMGHVDHGKTTLLDYIRKTNVAGREAGGITQAVGAYEIEHNGRKVTFIDTPGHEAFVKMRAAGAEVADLAVLVIAAEDGVKPQTKEAIGILRETHTPFVVALNKIDKKEANIEKVKNELAAAGVLLEGYGGGVSYHSVSAKTGEGVSDLLDLIVLASDMERLSYDPKAPASGFILEAKVDPRRGLETVAIVKNGILKSGDFIGTASTKGRIKILENFRGEKVAELKPSAPALIIGFGALPRVGETFLAASSEGEVQQVTQEAARDARKPQEKESGESVLKLILKAHDLGSLEALSLTIRNINAEKKPVIFSESVGDISDGDVKTAIATGAVIVGFKVRVNSAAKTLSEANKVKIITAEIIYELIKAVEEFLLAPRLSEATGTLEILAVFNQAKLQKQVIGGRVTDGNFRNKASFEIEREGQIAGKGRVLNLQMEKKDVPSVAAGNEAGLLVDADTLIKAGDKLIIKK